MRTFNLSFLTARFSNCFFGKANFSVKSAENDKLAFSESNCNSEIRDLGGGGGKIPAQKNFLRLKILAKEFEHGTNSVS